MMRAEDFLDDVDTTPAAPVVMAKPKLRAEDFLADVESPREPVVPAGPGPTVMERAANVVTGKLETEFPDVPDIGQAVREQQPMVFDEMPSDAQSVWALIHKLKKSKGVPKLPASFLFASDPAQKVDILRETYPDATFSQDKFGNPIIEISGQKAYVQKPGIQSRDVADFIAQMAMFGGGLGLASKAPLLGRFLKGGSTLAKAAIAGPVAGLTSAGMDVGAMAGGSKQGINLPRAGATTALGFTGEVLSPLVGRAIALIKRNPGLVDEAGTFTMKGEKVLREAGIDPAVVSDEMASHFRDLAQRATDPRQAARAAQSGTLPIPVPETLGSTSLSPSQQMTESMARKGGYGRQAEDIMRAMESRQQDALRENIPAIQAQVSGRQSPIVAEAGEGGQLAQQALVEGQERAAQAVNAAYKAAESKPALIEFEGVEHLAKRMEQAASPFLRHAPKAEKELGEFMRRTNQAVPDEAPGILVQQLFDWRRDASRLMRETADKTESAALRTMLGTFDDGVHGIVKDHLMAGSEDAARPWMRAINIKRGAVKRYEAKDLISDLVETEQAGGRGARLAVAPEAAANYILGASDLGFVSKAGLGRELVRLRGRLGADSDAWGALREEAFLRFARKAEGATEGSARLFSGVNMRRAWVDSWNKNPSVMRVMFGEKEKRLIDNFTDVAARVTGKVKGGDNPSGTALALANSVQNLTSGLILGPTGQAVLGRLLPPIYDIIQSGSLRRTALNPVPQIAIPGGYGAAVAAGALGPGLLPNQDIQYPLPQR